MMINAPLPPLPPFSGQAALDLVRAQTALGLRAPGMPGHEAVVELIADRLRAVGLRPHLQRWEVPLSLAPGGTAGLCNVLTRIPGRAPGPCTLLATHFDSRWIADREEAPEAQGRPIPGANDGGSGTAIQLELARLFAERPPQHDVILAFCDGEDLGDIEGHPFAVGSRHLATHPEGFVPDEVIALDMVGGVDMRLNIEINSLMTTERGRALFLELFALGRGLGYEPFFDGEARVIVSDQGPFLERGIPAVLLIDIDYPWWHTHGDVVEHCSAASLEAVGRVLQLHLDGSTESAPTSNDPEG